MLIYYYLGKQYVCHHSSYHKVDRVNNKRGRSIKHIPTVKPQLKLSLKLMGIVSTRKQTHLLK